MGSQTRESWLWRRKNTMHWPPSRMYTNSVRYSPSPIESCHLAGVMNEPSKGQPTVLSGLLFESDGQWGQIGEFSDLEPKDYFQLPKPSLFPAGSWVGLWKPKILISFFNNCQCSWKELTHLMMFLLWSSTAGPTWSPEFLSAGTRLQMSVGNHLSKRLATLYHGLRWPGHSVINTPLF